jgi:hypothetical protein
VHGHANATITGTPYTALFRHDDTVTLTGGVVIEVPKLTDSDPGEWCDYYGVTREDGTAVVFKAVDGDLCAHYDGTRYDVGATVEATDWDGVAECGGGLHFGPTPRHARKYNRSASRFLACRVLLSETVTLGDKVKSRACEVLHEVDRDGARVPATEAGA